MNYYQKKIRNGLILLVLLTISLCGESQSLRKMTSFESYTRANTLTFESYIHDSTDCGEWGGHRERIFIYETEGSLVAYYVRDSSNCSLPKKFKKNTYRGRREWHVMLTKEKQKLVKSYLKKFYSYIPPEHLFSNASNSFEVSFTNGDFTNSYSVSDRGSRWKEYEAFRNELMK